MARRAFFFAVFTAFHFGFCKGCGEAMGIGKQNSPIPDSSITASSHHPNFPPNNARLDSKSGWIAAENNKHQYLQIDLRTVAILTGIATQGIGNNSVREGRVVSHHLYHSIDGVIWSYIWENKQPKLFTGNVNAWIGTSKSLFKPILVRYVRFSPQNWYINIAMRVELFGCDSGFIVPLGMQNGTIKSNQITASSRLNILYKANFGRLKKIYGLGGWCAQQNNKRQYLQVDFNEVVILTGVATQGLQHEPRWVKSFFIMYRTTKQNWIYYNEVGSYKLFQGNEDHVSEKLNFLNKFVAATSVRIVPQSWQYSVCLRTELYGLYGNLSGDHIRVCTNAVDACDSKAKCHENRYAPDLKYCVCTDGYEGDGKLCYDLDECSVSNVMCAANKRCLNTVGSSTCVCIDGYTDTDGNNCKDIDECASGKVSCPYRTTCVNNGGSYSCQCNSSGFIPGGEGECIDINECANERLWSCIQDAVCINTAGSYRCFCKEGLKGDGDKKCTDIDECSTYSLLCPNDAACANTKGSYMCICKAGYTPVGRECHDINECAQGPQPCYKNSVCKNIPGSYACQCLLGYSSNKQQCVDVNECHKNLHECSEHALCYNTGGSYICICKYGYYGNGYFCSDKEEDAACKISGLCRAPQKSNITLLPQAHMYRASSTTTSLNHRLLALVISLSTDVIMDSCFLVKKGCY